MSEIVARGTVQAGRLRDYLGVFTPIVTEGRIHFNDDGLTVNVVDPANAAMYTDTTLATEAFEDYDAPGSVTIGVSFNKLVDRLKPADTTDLVSLAVDMETRKLHIEYGRAEQTLGLIDPESIRSEPDTPDLELPNSVTLTGDDISEGVTITEMVSDHIRFGADPETRSVYLSGDGDVDDATVTYEGDDVLECDVTEATESLYSLEYFADLMDPVPSTAEVTFHLGDDFPLTFSWVGADGHMTVNGLLAPRIQN